MGAFSIYLWVGVWELKEYPVINKILLISLITYTIIFITGLISFYFENSIYINTAFAFSFWIILILGFLLFGRKYLIVWRFISPQYLTLFLYIIGWLAVIFINQYIPIDFRDYIYIVLILVNILVYFSSGFFIDRLLGIKKIQNDELKDIVEEVKKNINIKGKVKIGYGEYPILNAMAYGPFFDRRIAIIAEDLDEIPEDELKGIVAHEMAHTKGNHTLILALITIGDLLFRMVVGIPATMYDYTFGNPDIPIIYFIIINIGIYIILYIFVRILEGFADLNAKDAGYKKELAKALYNLESFYATGRDFGLNTMLLCEEKITRYNQMMDYFKTAQYLNNSMIKPARISLLSSFLNSHPLSYHRIAAILTSNKELKPSKEAFLPLICLSKSKQIKYAKKFSKARKNMQRIATQKFKNYFNIEHIGEWMRRLDRKKKYKLDMNKEFNFRHYISKKIIVGKLIDVEFQDNICEPEYYIVKNLKTGERQTLNAALYSKKKVHLNDTYYIDKQRLLLKDINLKDSHTEAEYLFSNEKGDIIKKTVEKTNLPHPLSFLESFKHQDIFFRIKKEIHIYKCTNVKSSKDGEIGENALRLELKAKNDFGDEDLDEISISIKDLLIFPQKVQFSISKNGNLKDFELLLLKWMKDNRIHAHFYLKKPVNNLEMGYIQTIPFYSLPLKKSKNVNAVGNNDPEIIIYNIFHQKKHIKLNQLDFIHFQWHTAMIQKRNELSLLSKFYYKIIQKIKPARIIYV
jgi:Zn-dependent protease with chaperone function